MLGPVIKAAVDGALAGECDEKCKVHAYEEVVKTRAILVNMVARMVQKDGKVGETDLTLSLGKDAASFTKPLKELIAASPDAKVRRRRSLGR